MKNLFIFSIAILFLFTAQSCSDANAASRKNPQKIEQKEPEISYKIISNGDDYETKEYTKDSSGCIHFNYEKTTCICGSTKTEEAQVCGSYTIITEKKY